MDTVEVSFLLLGLFIIISRGYDYERPGHTMLRIVEAYAFYDWDIIGFQYWQQLLNFALFL